MAALERIGADTGTEDDAGRVAAWLPVARFEAQLDAGGRNPARGAVLLEEVTALEVALDAGPAAAPSPPPFVAELVRCADCRDVHHRSGRPWPGAAIPGGHPFPLEELTECAHGLDVTAPDLEAARRYCSKFNRRPMRRQE